MTRQTFWCLIVYWQRQLRYSNCVLCPSLWLLETRGLWRAEQWCLLHASLQTHNTVNCSNISHDLSLSWWARIGPLHSRLAFHYSLHSRADLVRLFATLFTLFWHTSLRGAGRLSNLLLLPFKLCRIAMWKVTPAHYKSFIVRFKYFNAKWVAWKGSIHFKDNTSQTIKQYHNSVAEIKFKSLINKMIKW